MELHDQVENLKAALTNLKESDRGFAKSLCDQFAERGLSPKQAEWVSIMLARATPKAQPQANVGDLSGIVGLFATAGGHLKSPKLLVNVNGKSLRLSVAGAGARVPGSINVTSTGSFENRDWYGRITKEGQFQPSNKFDAATMTAVAGALKAMGENPVEVAAAYGHETSNCCFCGQLLTDPRSVAVGYGPICAGHWGLPWG